MALKKRTPFVLKLRKRKPMESKKSKEEKAPGRIHRYYPVDDPSSRRVKETPKNGPKLRSTITPGTVLILVTTKHRGNRVIFLKQLKSGLLLVIGPYGINGVPLTRVDQKHVISTSTKLDISKVVIPEHIDDTYFKHAKVDAKKQVKEIKDDIFAKKEEVKTVESKKPPQNHIDDAKTIEAQLKPLISGVEFMKSYLKTPFALSNGQYPHQLVF